MNDSIKNLDNLYDELTARLLEISKEEKRLRIERRNVGVLLDNIPTQRWNLLADEGLLPFHIQQTVIPLTYYQGMYATIRNGGIVIGYENDGSVQVLSGNQIISVDPDHLIVL
jgi:hypothetical protein